MLRDPQYSVLDQNYGPMHAVPSWIEDLVLLSRGSRSFDSAMLADYIKYEQLVNKRFLEWDPRFKDTAPFYVLKVCVVYILRF